MAAKVSQIEMIGEAREVQDTFSAVHAGYDLALRYQESRLSHEIY